MPRQPVHHRELVGRVHVHDLRQVLVVVEGLDPGVVLDRVGEVLHPALHPRLDIAAVLLDRLIAKRPRLHLSVQVHLGQGGVPRDRAEIGVAEIHVLHDVDEILVAVELGNIRRPRSLHRPERFGVGLLALVDEMAGVLELLELLLVEAAESFPPAHLLLRPGIDRVRIADEIDGLVEVLLLAVVEPAEEVIEAAVLQDQHHHVLDLLLHQRAGVLLFLGTPLRLVHIFRGFLALDFRLGHAALPWAVDCAILIRFARRRPTSAAAASGTTASRLVRAFSMAR